MGLILTIPGARKRDAVESLIVKMGAEHGFGKVGPSWPSPRAQ